MKTIFRKELADHFTATRFAILAALLLMAALTSAFMAGHDLKAWQAEGLSGLLSGRAFLLLFAVPGAIWPVFMIIGYLAPLAALLMGFDAINRERLQGTLSKILAQPIQRGQVILGKYLAGLLTLAILTAALLMLVTGLGLAVTGLVPTPAQVPRLALFWLLSTAYLGFWLGVGLLSSIVCRSLAASALSSGAAWVLLAFFIGLAASGAAGALAPSADPLRPTRSEALVRETWQRRLSLISPVNIYNEAAGFLLDPGRRGLHHQRQKLDKNLNHRYYGRFTNPLPLGQAVIIVCPHLAALLALSGLSLWLSGLVFRRQEVKAIN